MAPGSVGHDVQQLCEPLLADHGLVIEAVDVSGAAGRRVVSIILDLAEDASGVLDLDRIGVASQIISEAIDASVFAEDIESLEVSSPGAERPLTLWRHVVHAVGRMLVLQRADGTSLRGRLTDADGGTQTIVVIPEVEGIKGRKPKIGAPVSVEWTTVTSARVEVELRGSDDDLPEDDVADDDDDVSDELTHEED